MGIKNIDVLFTSENSQDYHYPKQIKINKLKKLNFKTKFIKIKSDSYFTDKENWMEITFNHKALGFEKHLIIGNFNRNSQTMKIDVTSKIIDLNKYAYYYIDDINIEALKYPENVKNLLKEEEIKFNTEKKYTLKNALFNFDKAVLLDNSIDELDKLSLYLKENPKLNIEIYGHTDNLGSELRNQELSLQRAKAVSNYLIKKDLSSKRIKWFGFGAEQPVVKNNSEENRAINRRVAFKLIEL